MHERKKILWLVSWYPNKYDPFDGDFIQRHARAAALYDDIHVLFVLQQEAQTEMEEWMHQKEGLTEQLVYLPKQRGFSGKLINHLQWQRVYQQKLAHLIRQWRPQWIHVQVPWKAGLMALWAKRKVGLPYLVTEHWGIYNNVAADNINRRSLLFRFYVKKIFYQAAGFVSVSRFLAEGVRQALLPKAFTLIPNVVDTSLFTPGKEKNERFTFLHVSNMVALKNVEGLLHAFQIFLQTTGITAQLVLIGNRNNDYPLLAQKMNFAAGAVVFKGEIAYAAVAKEMQRAHVFVLNSNIENSPCVIGEALCSGLPVIATNVGGMPELLTPANGVLVPPGDDAGLATAMTTVYHHYRQYKAANIANAAARIFSPEVIGGKHHQLYNMQH